jgi:hypothetical protein
MTASSAAPIHGRNGDLVSIQLSTDARHLEDLLEALSAASFPVNPQLWHRPAEVIVEFPAWESDIEELRGLLRACGFNSSALRICAALAGFEKNM